MSLLEADELLRLQKVPVTREEAEVLNSWRNNAIRDLGIGMSIGSIASWLVTRRLNNFFRANIAAAVGISFGLWRCSKSMESSVEQSLSLHGTRLQRELAGIIVKKYQHDSLGMQLVSKYFISENVYDDLSPDKPKQRWRLRNFFSENLDSFQRTGEDSYENATHLEGNNMKKPNAGEDSFVSRRKTNQKSDLEQKKMSADGDADPFDCIFGPADNADEIHHQSPDASHTLPRKHGRSHRRSRRRHQTHQQETSDTHNRS
ncbi:PREDICTED: uncharacterized protein LOC109163829 isoform X2 [Ipomoea nil]|uniref:uncharacterized protein LOC109163829 isoform X2 n=1 Tax=Ipomoea nil TaxID=35883 RepID=UPI000900ABCE|nr:PREDICTED: uncharacterized protein LOC109163829 isoform X2 [Ipomoea nil]